MNELIKTIADLGLSRTVYDLFFAAGFVSVFFFVVFMGSKMQVPLWKSIVVVLIVYPTVVVWMFVMYWMESGFTSFGGNNIVRVFVYVPLVAYPVAKLLKIQPKVINGMLALGPAAVHAVSHFGCIFEGCCKGYPSRWGLYNIATGDIRFPTQPIEAVLAWCVIALLLIRARKRAYIPDGKEYPLMLAVFGGTRFLCEFLRDNKKIWFGCSSLAFHALFMFIVGVVWLVILKTKEEKLTY